MRFIHRLLLALALCGIFIAPSIAADISVTAANVRNISAATRTVLAGATITAGQVVYLDSATGTWKLAQCDGTAEEAGASGIGVAMNGAASGQQFIVATEGVINPGGTAIVAGVYIVSATAGSLALNGDVTTAGYYRTVLGVALTAGQINLHPLVSGTALP
jgi:hypothetical protein